MRRTLFVVNPAAGFGRAIGRWQRVVEAVRKGLPGVEVWHTKAKGDGAALARRGLEQGFEAVVAVGGDGTLGEVVDGFLSASQADRTGRVCGTWPAGSGCDTARHLGLAPDEPAEKLLRMLEQSRVKRLDAGVVHFTTESGGSGSRRFINIAAFGLAGSVARELESSGKRFGGTASYLLSSVKALCFARADEVELIVDGRREAPVRLHLGVLANSDTFGGGMRIADGADMEDGRFDFVTVSGVSRWRLLRNFPKIYRGTHFGVEGITRRLVRRVEASSPGTVWLNIDGEAQGRLPAVFELLPGALPFLLP